MFTLRTWMESISTENTRAPSLANSAARGLPTTSDLRKAGKIVCVSFRGNDVPQASHRLMTVTVFP